MALSVSEAVGDAAKAAVEAIGLLVPPHTPPAAPVTVAKRKTPSLPEGKPPPQIVVSVGDERLVRRMSARKKLKAYTLLVAVITGDGAKTGDDPGIRDWRQQIERALEAEAAWAAVPGWNRTTLGSQTPFDPAALSKDFNYALVTFTVEVIEPRA